MNRVLYTSLACLVVCAVAFAGPVAAPAAGPAAGPAAAPDDAQEDAPDAAPPIRVLLLTGQNNHDCQFTSMEVRRLLEKTGRFEVTVAFEPAILLNSKAPEAGHDVFFIDYNGKRWGDEAEAFFLDAVRSGTGVVFMHAANNAFPGWKEYEAMVGLAWREGTGHGRFHEFDVKAIDTAHPITARVGKMTDHPDELYHRLVRQEGADYRLLMTAHSAVETGGTGNDEPMLTVGMYGKGRICHTPLGHVWRGNVGSRASIHDPQLRYLLAIATEWAATGKCDIEPTAFGLDPAALTADSNVLTAAEVTAGFELLFDGTSTEKWKAFGKQSFPDQGWIVEDGMLVHTRGGGGGDIATVDQYENFELRCDWRVEPGGNSGIMYLVSEDARRAWETGPEMQVLDDERHRDGKNPLTSAGSLYGLIAAPRGVVRPAGEWNSVRLIVDQGRVEHWLNGTKVVEYALGSQAIGELIGKSKFAALPGFARNKRGHIVLQDHGDRVEYRNLRIAAR